MKREDVKVLLPIIQAYSEGKVVQLKRSGSNIWEDIEDVAFSCSPDSYRIKPESEYRPYESCDEMIKDYCERFNLVPSPYTMPMIWVKSRDGEGMKVLITRFLSNGVFVDSEWYKFKELFVLFTYLDDTPCGVKE